MAAQYITARREYSRRRSVRRPGFEVRPEAAFRAARIAVFASRQNARRQILRRVHFKVWPA